MNTKDKSKLNGKDLISIGIFTAVYFILNLLIAAAMGFIPLVNMMIPFASSLVLGIPMMLYFSKIKKFGMVLITYIMEMSRNVQSGNTQNLKSMVIQRSFPKWSVAERRKTAAASNQAACCACTHSRYLAGGSPSGLRV